MNYAPILGSVFVVVLMTVEYIHFFGATSVTSKQSYDYPGASEANLKNINN